jgi:outer membrane autotransporter protein
VDLKGTTFALISTYQTPAGWYLDGVAQLTDYSSSIQTRERGRVGAPDGLGLGLSVEGGYPIDIGGGLVIEPQAQLSYQKIKFDSFVDVDRITVDLQDGESLRGRAGGRIKKTFNPNTNSQWTLYAEGNLVHEFLKDRGITAGGISFASDSLGTSAQLGGGINAQVGADTTLFASVSYSKGLEQRRRRHMERKPGPAIRFLGRFKTQLRPDLTRKDVGYRPAGTTCPISGRPPRLPAIPATPRPAARWQPSPRSTPSPCPAESGP